MNGIMETGATAPVPTASQAGHLAPDIDCDAFIQGIYDQYGPLLVRYATRLLDGDWHKGEDIFQETAARAWKHARLLGSRNERLRPWLFTVTRNLVIDHYRARQVRPLELMPVEELDTSSNSTASTINSHGVMQALGELNEQQQTVIRLMYVLECSVDQAAEHLGIPPGTVKSRTFYAVRALRRTLEKQGILGV
ncbi:sigma-70 family RNA polymerase sigma factor [Streptomyces sp. ID05-18]|uniref:sigma-70 family RNA polymerase sigma factor n=1 Tax=Streptomyces sp. ID05-18 TaxID=3028662 RepID=UPI0029AE7244|nr:sigma-70 family RNA polymerase sigma factor [Streptomyces sp. ID05-18]MDX3488389.1 sigma-70 family RNA polymerase sigma factor [Streptomyces sp. ID05-18]